VQYPLPHPAASPPLRSGAFRRRAVATLTAVVLALQAIVPAGVAAQGLPDLGDESQSLITPTQERKLGESIVRQIRASGAYLEDPEVNDYLNELGYRLVAAGKDSRQDFEFFAVADPSVNAFALPGGFIGVNMGLILLAQTESELASVLAHEITHVTQRHLTRSAVGSQRSILYQLAALAVAVLASRSNSASAGDLASAAVASAQALSIQSQLNYTREHEYEADRIGFARLTSAGFDPNAMAAFMGRLQRSARFVEGNAPSYLRTHPITYERIAEAQSRSDGLAYRQVPDSLDFHLVRALLRSYIGTPAEAVQWFDSALVDQKFNSELATRYGRVAALVRADRIPAAREEFVRVEKMAPPHPMIAAMGAHVYKASGDYPEALRRFEAALAKYPNKMQLVQDYPETLLSAGRVKDAIAFLEPQMQRFPDNGLLHRTAAGAYAALGKRTQQHRHQAEYYAWRGDLPGAVVQLELALKANDGDFYEYSVVETRLRTMRRDLAEQQAAMARNG